MKTLYRTWPQLTLMISLVLIAMMAHGQIATDGTVGSAQSLNGPNYAIGAALGTQRGANLFHSFSTFNIHTGESATFSGPSGLQNVISRVTGGTLSSIDGTLRSEISGANFFFINPAGVLFGANAKLDVPAAFHVSTADELRFADGAVFSTSNPAVSTLSSEPVAAFGFTSAAPKRIEVNGSYLSVKEGQTLSLVGGDINLSNATIYAPAGRLNVASVGSAGEVAPTETDLELRGFGALGTMTMVRDPDVERITVDIGKPFGEVSLGDLDTGGVGGGAMFIRGGNWLNQGGYVGAATYGAQAGKDIAVSMAGAMQFEQGARLEAGTLGSGSGGGVTIAADTLTLLNGGGISATSWDEGNAGSVTVTARNLLIDGMGLQFELDSDARSTGVGGNVNLTIADTLIMQNGGVIGSAAFYEGNAGSVTVTARNLLIDGMGSEFLTGLVSSAQPTTHHSRRSGGAGGNVNLTIADTLTVQNGGQIQAFTFGPGNAGSVTVTARNLLIDGMGFTKWPTSLSSSTYGSTGAGGNINLIIADTLTVQNGGDIQAYTAGPGNAGSVTVTARNLIVDRMGSEIFTGLTSSADYGSTGAGGNVNVTIADTLTVQNGGQIIANTRGEGNAGSVTMTAGKAVILTGGVETGDGLFLSGLSVSAYSTGQAGNLTVTTPNLTLADGGGIFGTSAQTTGGNLFINVADLRLLNGGQISTSVFGDATTEGGNVEINSRTVVALDGSKITAQAQQGKGGNIRVNTEAFLYNAPSIDDVLNASSESTVTGNQGSVTVNTAIDPGGSIVGLSRRQGDLNDANQDPCARRKGQKKSTLAQVGRGGLPADNRPEGMTVSLGGSDWMPPAEAMESAPSTQEPVALNADWEDCRF